MKHPIQTSLALITALTLAPLAGAQTSSKKEPGPETQKELTAEADEDARPASPPKDDRPSEAKGSTATPGLADVEPQESELDEEEVGVIVEPELEERNQPEPEQPRRRRPGEATPLIAKAEPAQTAPCPDLLHKRAPNYAPTWNLDDNTDFVPVGQHYFFAPTARDPEALPITYRVVSLPPGAQVKWRTDSYHPCDDPDRKAVVAMAPRITWTPAHDQTGTYVIAIEAGDGEKTSLITRTLEVEKHEDAIFLPGAAYSVYAPKGHRSVYHGPSFELLLGGWLNDNADTGPGVGRIYTSIGMLQGENLPDAVQFNFGFDLSFEGRPKRSFLIPYFGLETGGLFRQMGKNVGHFTPTLGMHVVATRNIFFNVMGGHFFPTARIDELPGYIGRASLNLAFW